MPKTAAAWKEDLDAAYTDGNARALAALAKRPGVPAAAKVIAKAKAAAIMHRMAGRVQQAMQLERGMDEAIDRVLGDNPPRRAGAKKKPAAKKKHRPAARSRARRSAPKTRTAPPRKGPTMTRRRKSPRRKTAANPPAVRPTRRRRAIARRNPPPLLGEIKRLVKPAAMAAIGAGAAIGAVSLAQSLVPQSTSAATAKTIKTVLTVGVPVVLAFLAYKYARQPAAAAGAVGIAAFPAVAALAKGISPTAATVGLEGEAAGYGINPPSTALELLQSGVADLGAFRSARAR